MIRLNQGDKVNYLSIEHLEMLLILENTKFVRLEELSEKLGVSSRKIQIEINEINAILHARSFPFILKSDRKLGYYIQVLNRKEYLKVLTQVKCILEDSMLRTVNKKYRASKILRILLFSDSYLKSEELAETLNISLPTLSLDLKIVREIMTLYDLVLESKPYYGMKIVGSRMNILSAYLDFFDYYGYDNEQSIYYQEVAEELSIQTFEYHKLKEKLHDALEKHNLLLTTSGFRRILHLLILSSTHLCDSLDLVRISNIEQFQEYKAALSFGMDDQRTLLITYYILSNLDLNSQVSKSTHQFLYTRSYETLKQLNLSLIKEININLSPSSTTNTLVVYFIKYSIRKMFNILEYNSSSSLVLNISKKLATQSLAIKIYTLINQNNSYYLNDYMFFELCLLVYNIAYANATDYEQVKAGIIVDYYQQSMLSITKRINLDKFDIDYESIPTYLVNNTNLSKFDFILNASNILTIESDLPVFNIDYFSGRSIDVTIWEKVLMKKRKENHVNNQLSKIIKYQIKLSEVTLYSSIFEILENNGIFLRDYFEYMSYFLKAKYPELIQNELTVVFFSNQDVPYSTFIFEMESPFKINNNLISQVKVLILNPGGSMLSIKQMDSTIQRFNPKDLSHKNK